MRAGRAARFRRSQEAGSGEDPPRGPSVSARLQPRDAGQRALAETFWKRKALDEAKMPMKIRALRLLSSEGTGTRKTKRYKKKKKYGRSLARNDIRRDEREK